MSNRGSDSLAARLKLPFLVLLYPGFAWFLANISPESESLSKPNGAQAFVEPLNTALYLVAAIGLSFVVAMPLWTRRYRMRPQVFTASFRRGLYITAVLTAIILPVQGVLLAIALYIADPKELWVWGILTSIGGVMATVVLLRGGLGKQPGVYLTLRAVRIQVDQHPKLATELHELGEATGVPLPAHILLGLQPEMLWTTGTVFCPDGELDGGVLCLSLPTSSILSIAEFRALAGEALLGLHAWLREGRAQFISNQEAANDVLANLNDTMQQWSWLPKIGIHPALWIILIAAMRLPLYVGKEMLTYYLREFRESRRTLDVVQSAEAHHRSAEDVGSVQVVSALVKEAAVSLRSSTVNSAGEELHALGEVTKRVMQEHPGLMFEDRGSTYRDPYSAWRYLQFRCSLSGVNLEWCRQMALDVSPEPSAASLFEGAASLQARLVELAKSPFVLAGR